MGLFSVFPGSKNVLKRDGFSIRDAESEWIHRENIFPRWALGKANMGCNGRGRI
jgi:hypothetical protein